MQKNYYQQQNTKFQKDLKDDYLNPDTFMKTLYAIT